MQITSCRIREKKHTWLTHQMEPNLCNDEKFLFTWKLSTKKVKYYPENFSFLAGSRPNKNEGNASSEGSDQTALSAQPDLSLRCSHFIFIKTYRPYTHRAKSDKTTSVNRPISNLADAIGWSLTRLTYEALMHYHWRNQKF